jgi:hypothetical protein
MPYFALIAPPGPARPPARKYWPSDEADRCHRMLVMRVDDGGACGDVIVVADVPLRHIHEVVVADAARGVGHAGQAEIGAVREHRDQKCRLVRRRVAGAQMREAIGKAGPGIDVAQELGDAHPRQHAVEADRQVARRFWDRRLHARDIERAVFDLDAVELAACGSRHHDVQLIMQLCSSELHEPGRIGILANAEVPPRVGGQQIIFEGAIIAASGNPDVAAAQPLAQRGEHGDFVQTAVSRAVGEDQLAPFRRQERRRRPLRHGAGAITVHRLQDLDCGQHGVSQHVRLETERRQESRAEPAQHGVALGCGDEDMLIGNVGDRADDRQGVVQPFQPDLAIDDRDPVLTRRLRLLQRSDGTAKQQQRLRDIALGGLEAPLVPVLRFAEQRPDVLLEHGERCVRKPSLQVGGLRDQDRSAALRLEIGDVLDSHHCSLGK